MVITDRDIGPEASTECGNTVGEAELPMSDFSILLEEVRGMISRVFPRTPFLSVSCRLDFSTRQRFHFDN
jgi:hypothetical protein